MRLGNLELRVLEAYQRWRETPPTTGSLTWDGRWNALLFLALVLGVGWLALVAPPPYSQIFFFAAGMCFGAVLRDVGRNRLTARIWPLFQQVLDWPRIQELLRANADDGIDRQTE